MSPISLVIITKNEAQHIGACIQSVPFAQDVVVLDSDSSDETPHLAKAAGARVFVEPWRGFGPQKNRAVELAQHDWVLSLDADERLSSDLRNEIEELLKTNPLEVDAFEIPRMSFHLGRWIRHGGWYPDYQVRLFNRKRASWTQDQIHERVAAQTCLRLKAPIEHFVFRSLSHQIETNNRYSQLMAENLMTRGQRFSIWSLALKPISKFFETYIWKRGFSDGIPGLIIAVGAAYSVFLKWAKLWELEKAKASPLSLKPRQPK